MTVAAAVCAVLPACKTATVAQAGNAPAEKPAPPALRPVISDDAYKQMEKLAEIMLIVKKHYVEDKDYTNMINGALVGMLQSLDEHSYFMIPDQVHELQEDTSGHYGGVGLIISHKDGQLTVIAPVEDSPAYRAGVLAEDVIIKIDGETTAGMKQSDAIKKMRGKPGTKIVLAVFRRNETEPRTFEIARESINVPTVKGARMIRDGIGYVRVTQFAEPTAISLRKELSGLYDQGMEALVLDLRSNPGGLLKSAKDVSQMFLQQGSLVVSIRDRNGKNGEKKLMSEGSWHDTNTLMTILIDGGSASASEIVAGALQDQKRAILVGDRSFGKGSVQTIMPLKTAPDSAIRLTTAKYHTPSERVIHKHGIEPNIKVRVTPEERRKIQVRRAQIEQPSAFSKEDKEQYKDVVDTPLERAADLLQALLIVRSNGKDTPASGPDDKTAGEDSAPDDGEPEDSE